MVKSKKIRVTGPSSGTPRSDKFKCITCGVAFTNTNDLNSHRDTVHQVLYEDTPRKSLRIKERVAKKAKKGSTTASDVEIDECSGDKDDKTSANDGADEMYPDEQTFTCEHCGYTVKTKYSLTKHMRKNHLSEEARRRLLARPVLSCATCLKTFTHKTNLRKHVFNQHFSHLNKRETIWKRGYCCDVCGIGFGGQSDMLAHRQIVHEEEAPITWSSFCACPAKLKRCEKCSKYFRDGKQFAKHECLEEDTDAMMARIEEILKSAPSYKCDECSLCFHWKWMYRAHRENVHSKAKPLDWEEVAKTEVLFWCSLCFKAFDDDEMLEEHRPGCVVNREVKVQSFMCRFCDSSYCRKADYKRHLKIKHSNLEELDIEEDIIFRKKSMIKCPYCEFESNTKNTILNHIKVVHKIETETPFVCVPCNKVFKRKATMDTHNQIYHPKEENVDETNKILKEAEFLLNGDVAYHCTFCNRNILNAVRFVAHYRLHNLERKFTCDQCGKQTRTQHQLNAHIKIIHLNIRNFECDICGKSFHAKQSCEEHRRIHTGERPFSCEICGKTFIALNALFTHKKFHNDFYAHPCSMCPKKFKVRRSLINHIRTHTGERPFKCEICSKTFNNSSRFSYHKKVTHSDNRPFTCTQCGSCFKANKFLMRHMKLHKIRKNIQFRRRNNPAYFENHDSNPKKVTSKRKSSKSESSDVLELEKTDVQTTTITFHKLYDVENVVCKETESVMESVENSLDEKTHFLAEAFDENIVQMEYTESSESGRSVKHVACLRLTETTKYCLTEVSENTIDRFIYSVYSVVDETDEAKATVDETYLCTICGEKFISDVDLMTHTASVHDQSIGYACDVCNREFKSKNRLSSHIRSDHQVSKDPITRLPNGKYQCPICEKVFCRKPNANQHFMSHVAEKSMKCEKCEFRCHTQTQLEAHKKKHEKRFCCEICSKMFAYKFQLEIHVQGVHYNLRPFTCKLCSKTFKTKYNFGSHMAQHKDIRNFHCPFCPRRCRKSYDLRIHIRTHTGEKPFQCTYCQRAYSQNGDRLKHEKHCSQKVNATQVLLVERYPDNEITELTPAKDTGLEVMAGEN